MPETTLGTPAPGPAPAFATTHWSVVLTAKEGGPTDAARALESLCRAYWYPFYAFVRRSGYRPKDAQDLTQGFFARLLEKNHLAAVQREKGKFRTFLLGTLQHFLVDEARRAKSAKRGGGRTILSLDDEQAEARYASEPATEASPDRAFDQRWALAVLDRAVSWLRAEFGAAGKVRHFALVREFLANEAGDGAYARLAAPLGRTPGAVAVLVHRLRQRYRELVREEVAHTVPEAADVEEELRYLFSVLAG